MFEEQLPEGFRELLPEILRELKLRIGTSSCDCYHTTTTLKSLWAGNNLWKKSLKLTCWDFPFLRPPLLSAGTGSVDQLTLITIAEKTVPWLHVWIVFRAFRIKENLSCCYYVGRVRMGVGAWKSKVPKWNCRQQRVCTDRPDCVTCLCLPYQRQTLAVSRGESVFSLWLLAV